jgi:hypothetical protein
MAMHTIKTLLLTATAAMFMGGCHLPPPVARVVLKIPASGEPVLDGRPVAAAQLQAALEAKKQVGADLEVEVRASPAADIKLIRAAIESTKLAHVRASFAREEGNP